MENERQSRRQKLALILLAVSKRYNLALNVFYDLAMSKV